MQTWFAVALIGLGYAWLGGYAGKAPDIAFGWQWIERFIEILLLPIGYLRLDGASVACEPHEMYRYAWPAVRGSVWNALSTASIRHSISDSRIGVDTAPVQL